MTYFLNQPYILVILLFTAAWGVSSNFFPEVVGFFEFRFLWVQFSGALTLVLASAGVVLATRSILLDRLFGGMDKIYRIHRWIGIAVLCLGTFHWLLAKGTKWAVSWGWLERPQFGPPPARPIGELEMFFRQIRPDVLTIGEFSYYLILVSIFVAMLPSVSYRIFRRFHLVMPFIYAALIIHGISVFNFPLWLSAAGCMLILSIIAGLLSMVYIFFRHLYKPHEKPAIVTDYSYNSDCQISHLTVELSAPLRNYKAGQFAFLKLNKHDESHPFTLTNFSENGTKAINFCIRAMGDFTASLSQKVAKGSTVFIEGPFGGFTFNDSLSRQIWIAGGIGITPFLARLDELSQQPSKAKQSIILFFTVQVADPKIIGLINKHSEMAEVEVHLFIGNKQRLKFDDVKQYCADWKAASIWYCGPATFAAEIEQELKAKDFPHKHFHKEFYHFR